MTQKREFWERVKRDMEKLKIRAARELVKGVKKTLKSELSCEEKLSRVEELIKEYEEIMRS